MFFSEIKALQIIVNINEAMIHYSYILILLKNYTFNRILWCDHPNVLLLNKDPSKKFKNHRNMIPLMLCCHRITKSWLRMTLSVLHNQKIMNSIIDKTYFNQATTNLDAHNCSIESQPNSLNTWISQGITIIRSHNAPFHMMAIILRYKNW